MKMSIHFILFITVLFCLAVSFSSAATVTSAQTGDWSATTTWNTGNVPTASDSVIIRATDSVTVFSGIFECRSLTIRGKLYDTVKTVVNGGTGGLQVNNILTMEAGSYLFLGQNLSVLPGGPSAIKNLDPASWVVLVGTQASWSEANLGSFWIRTTSGGIRFLVDLNIQGDFIAQLSGSGVNIKGADATSGSRTHLVKGNLLIRSGVFSCIDGNAGTSVTGIWNIQGNVLVTAATASLARFGCFSSSGAVGMGIYNIDGNLTIGVNGRFQAGNSSTAATGPGIINLKGNFSLDSGAVLNTNNGVTSFTINFTGTGTQTVTNNLAGGAGFSNLNTLYDTIAVGSTVVFKGNSGWGQGTTSPNPAGKFLILGTAQLDTSNINGIQDVEVAAGGSLLSQQPAGLNGALTTTGVKTLSTAGNYKFNGTVAQVTGALIPAAVNDLTIDNAGGVALSQAIVVNNVLRLMAGVLDNSVNPVTLGPNGSIVYGGGSLAVPMNLDLSFSSLDFGTITVGQIRNDSVTVTNHGAIALNITSVLSTNSKFTVTPASVSVGAGITQKFHIAFAPTAAGVQNGLIVFTHNAASSPDTVRVTGTGSLTPVPAFSVVPNTIDFGTVMISASKSDSVLVSNPGIAELQVTAISSSNAHFTMSPTTMTLAPAGSAYLVVTFTPLNTTNQTGSIILTHNASGSPDTVAVSGVGNPQVGVKGVTQMPTIYRLRENYPNPFNPSTTIQYDIPRQSKVVLKVYSLLGQEIATLVDGVVESGYHQIVWKGRHGDGSQAASGVYLFRMSAQTTSGKSETFMQVKKMLLVK